MALPDYYHNPSHGFERLLTLEVARAVARNFVEPEFAVFRWEMVLAFMPVPEATVNEDSSFQASNHNVGAARERFHMQSVSQSLMPQVSPHNPFGLRVLAAYVAHALMPLLWCHLVCHRANVVKIRGIARQTGVKK